MAEYTRCTFFRSVFFCAIECARVSRISRFDIFVGVYVCMSSRSGSCRFLTVVVAGQDLLIDVCYTIHMQRIRVRASAIALYIVLCWSGVSGGPVVSLASRCRAARGARPGRSRVTECAVRDRLR